MNNRTACYCSICLQFQSLSHLKRLSPRNYDREIATEKRHEIVNDLALYYGIKLSMTECEDLADNSQSRRDVAYLAYTKSLFERIQFSEGGVYMLALWREIAWNEGRPIDNFEFDHDDIFDALQRITTKLLSFRD